MNPRRRAPRPLVIVLGASLTLASALAVGLSGIGCRRAAPPPPELATPSAHAIPSPALRRVYLLTVDTLRADHMSAYGYPRRTSPRFDALAEKAWLFERAFAQWPKTGTSFASMFTGRYPQSTGITHAAAVELPADLATMPAFFAERGFTTAAVVSNPMLMTKLGWSRHFDEYHETWVAAANERGAPTPEAEVPEPLSDDPSSMRRTMDAARVNALALPMLERLRESERLFAWIHWSDPHAPYILPEGVTNPFLEDAHWVATPLQAIPRRLDRQRRLGRESDRRFYVASYDANILVADAAIGEVIDRLEALDLLEDSLVVVTADHGESLGEHDSWFEHGPLPYNTTSHVPLLLWRPGAEAARDLGRIGRPVELVDLFPTLRDWVDPGAVVAGLEGKSLLPLLGVDGPSGSDSVGESAATALTEAGKRPRTHFRTIQSSRFKLIYDPDPRELEAREADPAAWQLYDLRDDPRETRDLLAAGSATLSPSVNEALRGLRRQLLDWSQPVPFGPEDVEEAQQRDREVRKALRALGYVQ